MPWRHARHAQLHDDEAAKSGADPMPLRTILAVWPDDHGQTLMGCNPFIGFVPRTPLVLELEQMRKQRATRYRM